MNILMIGWYKPQVGGGSQVVQNLAIQLKKEHRVYIINMEELNFPRGLRHWNDDGVEVYQEKMFYFKKYTSFQTLFQTTKRALILRKKVDIYHAHGPFFAGAGFIDKKKPLVITFHGYPSLETLAKGRIKKDSLQLKFMRFLEIKTAHRADAIIAVDKRIYNWIINDLSVPPAKVFHIPNAVDTKKFNPHISGKKVTEKYNLKNKKVLVYVKALSPKNGPETLIKAMPQIIRRYPTTILMMVGNGPLKDYLINLAKKLNVYKNIIFVGSVNNEYIPQYYASSDVVIVPSVHISNVEEATSLTMLEGMASGKPVVVSNIGGLKEVMMSSKNKRIGVMFEEGNPEDLAEKIIWLLDNPEEAKEIGMNAREFVEKHYTWEINARKVMDVYKYAIEHQGGK